MSSRGARCNTQYSAIQQGKVLRNNGDRVMKRLFDFLNRLVDADDDVWDHLEAITHYATVIIIASFIALLAFQFMR